MRPQTTRRTHATRTFRRTRTAGLFCFVISYAVSGDPLFFPVFDGAEDERAAPSLPAVSSFRRECETPDRAAATRSSSALLFCFVCLFFGACSDVRAIFQSSLCLFKVDWYA